MRIFFSYPHDENSPLVERIKGDLEARGHEVWFDGDRIKSGDDWRNAITRGILESEQVVAFLSRHAVRDPGVCLNEIAIALADKGEALVTVLVEPETEVSAPVSITHIQWLAMDDWKTRWQEEGWYRTQVDRLIDAIERPGQAERNQELATLKRTLDPISFHAEIAPHIPGFTGRHWIIDRYRRWLDEEPTSRVLRLEGGPGLGKTAVASYLAHSTKTSVLAVHLCQWNKGDSRNPLRLVRTLAYQLATRLPDYRARLLNSVAIQRPETQQGKDAATLWSDLISAPFAGSGKGVIDRQRLAIIIDGLDEATEHGKNAIVELLASEIDKLPKWIGVVLTGRPDPELTQRLARYKPLVLSDDDPQNLADLKVYVDAWLDQEVKAGTLPQTQAQAASEALLEKSQGAFLYLTQARGAVAEGMLDLTRPGDFPSGLTEIYQRFFERRFPDAADSAGRYKAKVRPLLELILASPETLPVSIAKEILHWGPYDGPETIKSLGSLLKRAKGGLAGEEEETLAPFHNSVREWLQDPEAAGDFHVSAELARYPLTEAVWRRYLRQKEKDTYGWQVLPDLLPLLPTEEQERLLGEPAWEISQVLFRLADSLAPKLRFSEAAAIWKVQIAFGERLAATSPDDVEIARRLGSSYDNFGGVHKALGNTRGAMECYERALAIQEQLANNSPDNVLLWREIAKIYDHLGNIHRAMGNRQTALEQFNKALAIQDKLLDFVPDDVEALHGLSVTYNKLGSIRKLMGDSEVALNLYERSLQIRERLAKGDPENDMLARSIGISYSRMGNMHKALGDSQLAIDFYRKSLAIKTRLFRSDPDNPYFARDMSICHNQLGTMEKAFGNVPAAAAHFLQALGIRERLFASAPENAQFASDRCMSYGKLASVTVGDEQLAWWKKAHDAYCTMQTQGILNATDEKRMTEAKVKLGLA